SVNTRRAPIIAPSRAKRNLRSPITDHRSHMDTTEILKKIRTLEIKTRGLVETAFAGDYHSVFKGRGMNFEDVREYQPGDEIRSFDWNVTARMGTAYVKKFTEERDLTVMLIVDVSASGYFGSTWQSKRALAAEVTCLLAFSAIHIHDEREKIFPNIGIITLEDADTGEQVEVNTPSRVMRAEFADLVLKQEPQLSRTLRRNNIDAIALRTGDDYLPALRAFFKQRERRLAIR